MTHDADFRPNNASVPDAERTARRTVAAIVITLVVVTIAYRVLVLNRVQHTSLVFVGLPALAALVLLYTRPQTAIGTINKVIAILLCLSGILFGEGLVCILFAAPIFFLVGTIVGYVINRLTGQRRRDDPSRHWSGLVALAILPFSAEGVAPGFEFGRDEQVTVVRTVVGDTAAVRAALAAEPRFDRELPPFLRLGFPVPMHTEGSGLRVGDRRAIAFSHGRHHSGALVMSIAAVDSASVRFTAVDDSSYITHWLAWQDATVRWQPAGPGRTRVAWTLRYRRRLDPAWYFAPLERYGVTAAADYLIQTLATPPAVIPSGSRVVIPSGAAKRRSRGILGRPDRGVPLPL